jgi:hypothetical protein
MARRLRSFGKNRTRDARRSNDTDGNTLAERSESLFRISEASVVGLFSGIVSFMAYAASIGTYKSHLILWIAILGPGIVYGIILTLYLVRIRRATLLRAAALVPLATAAYYASLESISLGRNIFGRTELGEWLSVLLAGTIAAVGLIAAMCLLFSFFRRARFVTVTIFAGAVAASLYGLPIKWHVAVPMIFILWQVAVTACIGWAAANASTDQIIPARHGLGELASKWLRPRWLLTLVLPLSLVANLGFAARYVVFEPIVALQPQCFDHHHGVIPIEGRTTDGFRTAMVATPGTVAWHVDAAGSVYISRWHLWMHRVVLWNWTRQVAEGVYRKKTGKAVPENALSGGCAFIRPRVLEPNPEMR